MSRFGGKKFESKSPYVASCTWALASRKPRCSTVSVVPHACRPQIASHQRRADDLSDGGLLKRTSFISHCVPVSSSSFKMATSTMTVVEKTAAGREVGTSSSALGAASSYPSFSNLVCFLLEIKYDPTINHPSLMEGDTVLIFFGRASDPDHAVNPSARV